MATAFVAKIGMIDGTSELILRNAGAVLHHKMQKVWLTKSRALRVDREYVPVRKRQTSTEIHVPAMIVGGGRTTVCEFHGLVSGIRERWTSANERHNKRAEDRSQI
jgi:hypothetical protein